MKIYALPFLILLVKKYMHCVNIQKKYLSIVEIENKKCQICSNTKQPAEVISDKLIMILDGLPTSDLPRQIDHPKCTILTKDTIVLDVML